MQMTDPDLFVDDSLTKREENHENQEVDAVAGLKQKQEQDAMLKQKRSLFVRMVSDPKIYNPKIVKARSPAIKARPSFPPMDHSEDDENPVPGAQASSVSQPGSQASPMSTWISWPLAFMFQDIVEEVTSEVPFRHWDSTLSIKPGAAGSTKTSPESDQLRPVSPNPTRRRSKSPYPAGVKSPTKNPLLGSSSQPKASGNASNRLSPPKQQ
ncbi:unnamed protein product [Orchesella dallaii]|uniref:Uncharacterized protein n=1 Tax=Orchesella dallaii TaxID=48710 RepID=A0ABP1PUU9_9HEXA